MRLQAIVAAIGVWCLGWVSALPVLGQPAGVAPLFDDPLAPGDSAGVEVPLPPELLGPVEAMEAGDYVAAVAELQGIVLQDSTHVQALRLLASALIRLDAHIQAAQVCRRIAAEDSSDAGVVATLGFLHQKQGAFDAAEQYYRQALQMDAGLVQAYQGLGWIYLQRRQLQQAMEMVTRTAERAPDYAANYILMGRVLTAQGFFENAKQAYERAFALNPGLREQYGILLQELVLRHRLIR